MVPHARLVADCVQPRPLASLAFALIFNAAIATSLAALWASLLSTSHCSRLLRHSDILYLDMRPPDAPAM